ncbi:hypothetical protein [Mucilaginibacter ginsenosidivorax]|uniref:O-antigen ligase family protein n=1 Tax=Mucilaginibacter ginsenosidivorax TaxID=862126 RepID=A0A5B8W209_9SPHI|nr:hypothetical protein [Mucilaginibacter ginsenosidivorax]QEC78080.1 hypothetical protein FSB76_19865 [Mucilaginibacter ginsenosidivorax]
MNFLKRVTKDRLLVFLLLIASGDPALTAQSWTPGAMVAIAGVLFFYYRARLKWPFYRSFFIYIFLFVILIIYQYYTLGASQGVFLLGFIIKIFIGIVVMAILGARFSMVLLDVMYFICLISFPFYLIHFIGGDNVMQSFFLGADTHSVGLYTFRGLAPGEHVLRNSGMFWEPTAFQGYINVALFLNFRRLNYLMANQRKKLAIIFIAFLSTISTTGFFLFAVLVVVYLLAYTKINKAFAVTITVIFFTLGIYLFNSLDFLGSKVQYQFEDASTSNGDYNTTRFGEILFDYHYIQKHPFTGNGFNAATRFADDPEIVHMIENGKNPGLGNGFTDFIACAGLIGTFWFFYILYKNVSKVSKVDAIFLIIVIIISLQGEAYLRYPFFLGLPFLIPLPILNYKNYLRSREKQRHSNSFNLS